MNAQRDYLRIHIMAHSRARDARDNSGSAGPPWESKVNLSLLREYELSSGTKHRMIHQSSPRSLSTTPPGGHFPLVDQTTVSTLCSIGPQVRHFSCQVVWCRCPCHDHDEYGRFCGKGM